MYWMDMSPEYIYFDQDPSDGRMTFQFLLLDLIFRNKFFEMKRAKIGQRRFPYIHLELFKNLKSSTRNPQVHFYKENTYSLGLIILSLAINFDLNALYYDLLPSGEAGESDQGATRRSPHAISRGI